MADRFAVVTGAGTGIGRASALALMNDGWGVALAGRRVRAVYNTPLEAGIDDEDDPNPPPTLT